MGDAVTGTWRVGDVVCNGEHRWRVETVRDDGLGVLRSVSSPWATTNPLTVAEFDPRDEWSLEPRVP